MTKYYKALKSQLIDHQIWITSEINKLNRQDNKTPEWHEYMGILMVENRNVKLNLVRANQEIQIHKHDLVY